MSNSRFIFNRFFTTNRRKHVALRELIRTMDLKVGGQIWKSTCKIVQERVALVGELFARQCNVIAAQRLRRGAQIVTLYQRLYGGKSQLLLRMGEFLKLRLHGKTPLAFAAAFFCMKDESVKCEEIESCVEDLKPFFDCNNDNSKKSEGFEKWEKLLDQPHFKLWRSPVPGSHLYQYRVYGTYTDISARAFFRVQLDLVYRKKWDAHVIKLEQLQRDEETGSEVIHWVTKYPLGFMYNRDYVYVRRCQIDERNNQMVIISRSVEHPECPVQPEIVRVANYKSQMVIRPHTNFDSKGFEYVMSYYDEPQLSVPTRVINWMTYQSLPGFLKELHDAAKKLKEPENISLKGGNSQTTESTWYQSSQNSSSAYR